VLAATGGSMASELHAMQIHLWILTAVIFVLVFASAYCNISRIKPKKKPTPYEHMNYLLESERFEELLDYASKYLKTRPGSDEALYFHSLANIYFEQYETAKYSAEKLSKISPLRRELAFKLLKMIDEFESGS
jgi:hypothetical protein